MYAAQLLRTPLQLTARCNGSRLLPGCPGSAPTQRPNPTPPERANKPNKRTHVLV